MALPVTRPPRRPRPLTASASQLGGITETEYQRRLGLPWQRRALSYIDMVPEVNYASRFYSRMLTKVRLYPGLLDDNENVTRVETGLPVELLSRIQDPGGGRGQLLASYGRLMFATGEGLLFGRYLNTERERWQFIWNDELQVILGADNMVSEYQWRPSPREQWITFYPEDSGREPAAVAYRVWTPHPAMSAEADAPMRACLDIAEELIILTAAVRSTAVTRMTNGIIVIPTEMSPNPVEPDGDEDPLNNVFLRDLTEHITSAIENPGSAEGAAPFLIEGAYDYLDRLKWFQTHDPQTDYMEKELRKEAIQRLAYGLDMPPEALTGLSGTNHWCQSDDTEILTMDRGFVTHDQLKVGDMVRTLNHETGMTEWQPVEDIYRAAVVDEQMVAMDNQRHSSLSTREHRWPIINNGHRYWRFAEDLGGADQIVRAAPAADLPTMKTYDDAFVETVAWFVTEGTCTWPSEKHCQVRIGQSHVANPDLVDRIRDTLTEAYGTPVATLVKAGRPAFREDAEDRGMTLFHLNKQAYGPLLNTMESWRSKVLKPEFILALTADQLELFLEVCALGDGEVRGAGFVVGQKDEARLAPIELAGILSGRGISWTQRESGGFTPFTCHFLSVLSSKRTMSGVAAMNVRIEKYTGTVWCPTTKNRTWLAKRNGKVYYTGNSAIQVINDMWSSHGYGIAQQFANGLNQEYLRPAARDAGYPDWNRLTILVDAAEVTTPPDRSQDADQAFDRGAISRVGYRKLKNIPEDMASSDDDIEEWLAVKLRDPVLLGTGDTSVTDPREGPPPPGPEGDSGRRTRVVRGSAAPQMLGAAALAVARCRELAGIRVKQKEKHCPEVVQAANGTPMAQLAAFVGEENLCRLQLDALTAVRGGADTFRSLLPAWGVSSDRAHMLADMIEVFAARTLFDVDQPALPAEWDAHFEGETDG